jgi:hypothetical protein
VKRHILNLLGGPSVEDLSCWTRPCTVAAGRGRTFEILILSMARYSSSASGGDALRAWCWVVCGMRECLQHGADGCPSVWWQQAETRTLEQRVMPSAAATKPRFRRRILSNRLGSAHLASPPAMAKFDWDGVCETDFNAKRPTRPATRHPLPFSINSHRSQTWPPFSKQVLCKSSRRLKMRPRPFADCPLQLQEKKVRRRYASPLLDSLFSHIPLARRLYNSPSIALLSHFAST